MSTAAAAAAATEANEVLNQSALLDELIKRLGLKNDAALSRRLRVMPPVISKIRHGGLQVGATILISMHEETGLSIKDLRLLMGDRREKFREGATVAGPKAA